MKLRTILLALICCITLGISAKDVKTAVFTTQPQMHCANCENTIKNGLKFEKGIKDIVTNLDDKTVTVKYDADKTNPDNIVKALKKVNYTATEVTGAPTTCPNAAKGASCCKASAEKASCCKANTQAAPCGKCGDKAPSCQQGSSCQQGGSCCKASAEKPACCKAKSTDKK